MVALSMIRSFIAFSRSRIARTSLMWLRSPAPWERSLPEACVRLLRQHEFQERSGRRSVQRGRSELTAVIAFGPAFRQFHRSFDTGGARCRLREHVYNNS